ncbi:choice-of-anchor B family protein [Thalassotalea sp. 1_MG-2023]|uniref:choice-of-anchor B family protein n=1 Tax=Thalassotalea sp. 1_MG-2023 TaxID=3062680 RepID=UPI0026E465C2|nr:choice-of-anchor B family protein [Thalassotalea sp. 1_MG-2023]MDO6427243.1 choice-of-anchor B family protein [Thalassotalea sp. 1_MG-2023]
MRTTLSAILLLISALLTTQALAHSEHDRARFVAPDGKDIGKCDNALRPCKTIAYAVTQANKGDKVLVASGEYHINDTNELFYLKSKIVPIRGGYNKFDHYQSQSPATNISTLVGIPHEFANELASHGFNIITDRKALKKDDRLKAKLTAYQSMQSVQQNVNCVNGKAGSFDCNNIDLLGHLPLSELSTNSGAASDIWGHVDLNTGKEYAIIGLERGAAVIDVSDPSNPTEVGAVNGRAVVWRDIKVYQYFDKNISLWQAYAYVTLDGASPSNTEYVTIIDLNNLPHSINVIEKNQTVYNAHNVYISNVDYSLNIAHPNTTPILHLAGTNKKTGQFLNYDLTNPKTLTQLTDSYQSELSVGSRPYTHDGASMTIKDSRKDTDCVNAQAFCTIFFDFNESEFLLWDITDTAKTTGLGRASYSGAQYVHSGWSTEDNNYVFVHDELDEVNLGINTTLRIFDITNLKAPTQVGTWIGDSKAIDHNGFVRGNRYYMSNYERGLTVLDITDPASPEQVGFFDTFTPSDNASFNGAWGVYPFLPSGNIIVSDINSGLFIFKDNTLDEAQGTVAFSQANITTNDNETLSITIERNNADATSNEVSVDYVILPGSADSNDFQVANGSLTWAANDNSQKTIEVDISENNIGVENNETFFVKLFNPSNGASLGHNSYITVTINGEPDFGAASFALAETQVPETQETLSIAVNRLGNSQGEISFAYQLTGIQASVGDDVLDAAGQLTWADGNNETQYIDLTIIDDELEEQAETFSLTLSPIANGRIGTNGTITITIADDDTNNAPNVTLSENFQVNTGQTVNLTATAQDNDNDDMTYQWQQTAGTNVELTNADQLEASFIAPNSATNLTFSFTATDFRGATTTESIEITVVAPTVTEPNSGGSSGGGSWYWLTFLMIPMLVVRHIRR